MPIRKIAGSLTTGTASTFPANQLNIGLYTADYTAKVTEIHYYSRAVTNVKLAVWDGVSPSDPLLASTVDLSSADVWNVASIANFNVISGQSIALGGNSEGANGTSLNGESRNYYYRAESYSVSPTDPIGVVTYHASTISSMFRLYGWIAPTTTGINSDAAYRGAATRLEGVDFMDSQGTGELWLTDSATWGAETIARELTPTDWTDEYIEFSHDEGDLAEGTYYLHVITDLGLQTETGQSFSLSQERLFFGNNNTQTSVTGLNFHALDAFASSHTGKASFIRLLYSGNSGNGKFNIYEKDVTLATSDLLYAVDTPVSISGDTKIPVSCDIVQSNEYYVGGLGDASVIGVSNGGEFQYKGSQTFATFTAPSTLNTYSTYAGSSLRLEVYGLAAPTISSLSVGTLHNGDTGLVLSGDDFEDSGATLELCDSATYATATKVSQTINSQSNQSIDFDLNVGTFADGTYYLFVTTDAGQQVSYEIDLESANPRTLVAAATGSLSTTDKCWQHEIDNGCILGEEFRDQSYVTANGGSVYGGASFSRFTGFTSDGTGQVDFEPLTLPQLTAVVLFSATGEGVIACSANLDTDTDNGWCIWIDDAGIYANHSDGVSKPTECSLLGDYMDGETRMLTYTVDPLNGRHMLYVDDLGVLESTTQTGPFSDNRIGIGGATSDATGFTGTINAIKIYDEVLEPRDHFLYNQLGDN